MLRWQGKTLSDRMYRLHSVQLCYHTKCLRTKCLRVAETVEKALKKIAHILLLRLSTEGMIFTASEILTEFSSRIRDGATPF